VNAPAAKNRFIDDTGFGCGHGDHASHILGADGSAQDGIDLRSVPAAAFATSAAHAGAPRFKASALVAASVAVFFKTSRRVGLSRMSVALLASFRWGRRKCEGGALRLSGFPPYATLNFERTLRG
jgi:hypothetical protein